VLVGDLEDVWIFVNFLSVSLHVPSQIIVIIVIWIVSLLMIYMLFLMCLEPLLNKRIKSTAYTEHTNDDVISLFP